MTNGHINPANVPDIALKDGHSIPQVGLGMLRIDDEGVAPVVESALEAGYRHIDGAAGYNNEAGVGRALAASGYNTGAKRETLWVTRICDGVYDDVPEQAFSGIGGIDDLEKKWHDLQKELGE